MKTNKRTIGVVITAVLVIAILWWIFNKNGNTPPKQEEGNLKIGAILALTGPNAAYGINARMGLDLARQDIIAKYPQSSIEIKYEDSQSTPARGITAYQQLVSSDDCKIIFGNASFLAKAVSPLVEKDNVLFMALGTTMPDLVEGKKTVLRHFPVAANLASIVAEYANNKFTRVAVLNVDDEYGRSVATAFEKQFVSANHEIVFKDAFTATATDLKTLVDKALAANPDAIYVPGYGPAFSSIILRVKEVSPNLPILGDLALVNSNLRSALGANAEGIVVPALPSDAGIAKSEHAKQFIAKYRKDHNENPDILVVTAYDALWIVFEATKATGTDPASVKQFIVTNNPHETLNGPVEYSKDGDSMISPELLVVKNGQLAPIN